MSTSPSRPGQSPQRQTCENRENQSNLLREGANDLVLKPIEERLLVTKTLFQLRVAKLPEQRSLDA